MIRCPVCREARVVIVLDTERRAWCLRCGARWVQEGSFQRAIRANHPSVGSRTFGRDQSERFARRATAAGSRPEGPRPGRRPPLVLIPRTEADRTEQDEMRLNREEVEP